MGNSGGLESVNSRFNRDWIHVEEDRYIRNWLKRFDGSIPEEFKKYFNEDHTVPPSEFNLFLETFEDGY